MSAIDVRGEVHLRPYQEQGIEGIEDARQRGVRRLLAVAPTGSGKTVLIGRVVSDALLRGETVLVVAHRRELIQQTYRKLCDAGVPEEQIGVIMGDDTRRRPSAPVQVASIDTLRRRVKPDAQLVIIDEAHRALAASYVTLREAYPDAFHLGFTATPYRADNRGLGEYYDELLVVTTIGHLIDLGFLVEARVLTVPKGELPNLRGVHTRGGDYDQKELADAVDQQRLVGNIVEHWMQHAGGVRTVAFAVTVMHSKHIADRFCAAGIPAEHLDGMTPASERDAILARLDAGTTRVVTNVGVLCEGWDQPSVKCCILARPTKSTGLYIQQAGRILRPWTDPETGVAPRALILDHAGCAREHGLPQDEREFSLEATSKQARKQKPKPTVRVCDGCQAVLRAQERVCPECGFFFTETREVPEEVEGALVEARPGEPAKMVAQQKQKKGIRESWARGMQRTVYEQLRALARSKKQDEDWAVARFQERYGAPPADDWRENSWGAL